MLIAKIPRSRRKPAQGCEEKLITQSRYRPFKASRKSDKVQLHVNFFEKCLNTSKKSQAHLQCVHYNCTKFEDCQQKGVGGIDYTK
jgi:hypothetical protein